MREINDNMETETSASLYDAVNAFLISSIIVIGTIVSVLFLIWLTMIWNSRPAPLAVYEIDLNHGNEKPEGFADDVQEPGVEEFPEVETPQLADALEAITDAVSSVKASIEARDGDAVEQGAGAGYGSRDGGPGGGGGDGVPEHKRWKIEYDAPNITEYAKQLSSFNIDIGVIANVGEDVIRLRQPGGQNQVIRTTRKEENKKLYFIHQKQRLRRWDESLVRRASLEVKDAFTVQFYPDSTRQILRAAEAARLQSDGKLLKDVLKTYYKVVPAGGGFTYEITAIDYK